VPPLHRAHTHYLWLTAVSLLPVVVPAGEPPAGPAKTHVLFMGVDLDVQQEKKLYRVEDVVGSEFKIRIGQKEYFVPTRNRTTGLKVVNALKLTSASVQVDDLQGDPTYTPAKDPRRKFNARTGTSGALQSAHDWSTLRQGEAVASLEKAQMGPPEFRKNYENIIEQENDNLGVLNQQMGSDLGSIPTMANELAIELAKGDFDAVEVSFKLSSLEELADPYMVVLVEFQPREAKPGETGLLIHAKALGPVGPTPRAILMQEGGMPVGFKILRQEVHIYNHGEEIATNLSSKRVELTREEAREYLVIEHIGTHKGATVAASAVPGTLSPARRQQLTLDQLNRTLYAKVSKEGNLLGAFTDESCSVSIDNTDMLAALGEVFFKPALFQGKPVEAAARLRLADL